MTKPKNAYRCWSCKERFRSWAAAQRHVDGLRVSVQDDHGGRIEIVGPE